MWLRKRPGDFVFSVFMAIESKRLKVKDFLRNLPKKGIDIKCPK